jgi:hypothetical protein
MGLENTPRDDNNRNLSSHSAGRDDRPVNSLPEPDSSGLTGVNTRFERLDARSWLRQYFQDLAAQEFHRWSGLRDEDVYQHVAQVLFERIRQDHIDTAIGPVAASSSNTIHEVSNARRLAQVMTCCFDLERDSTDCRALGEVFRLLADEVVFLKGIFHSKDIEAALDLVDSSGTRLPRKVRCLADVAELAYGRASTLVAVDGSEPNASRKAALFGRLGANAVDCIRGVRRMWMEIKFQAYGLGLGRSDRPDLFVFGIDPNPRVS